MEEIKTEMEMEMETETKMETKTEMEDKPVEGNCLTKCCQDQDFQQKKNVAITVMFEFYRVLVSSLLILFVPQKCGDAVCSYSENMIPTSNKYYAGLTLNFVTMCWLVLLYGVEIKRENRLITYLEVNKLLPTDNESVGKAMEHLNVTRRNQILGIDWYYQKMGMIAMMLFLANTTLSGLVIYDYYLDNQTTTTFVTNVLFMLTKILEIYGTIQTEKNVFYSAYMVQRVQFNDVDPDKYEKEDIENNKVEMTII